MKNILFLTPRIPYPVIGGDRIKSFNLLKHLSSKYNVTLVTFYQGTADYFEYVKEIEKLGIKVYVIELYPISKALEILFKFLGNKPLEILFYFDKQYKSVVDKILKENNIDIAFAFFMRTAEYLIKKDVPKVLIAEDCRKLYQYRSFKESNTLLQKLVRWWEFKKLSKYETKTMTYFDLVTFVTIKDIEEINKNEPTVNTDLLTNGTNIVDFEIDNSLERKGLLFVGKLDLWANQMMIEKIVKNVMPELVKKYPDVLFSIVGANPPQSLYKIENRNIKIFADVPDIFTFYQQNLIFLHPHEGATGIQNKLLEAMAAGLAVVSTKTGIQGINGVNGEHFLVSENIDDFRNKVLLLLESPEYSRKMGEKARQLIIDTHSWKPVFSKIDEIIEKYAK